MKDGDSLIKQLKRASKQRNDIAIIVLAILYQPLWWYWLDWQKINRN